jgi:hypothetical protein
MDIRAGLERFLWGRISGIEIGCLLTGPGGIGNKAIFPVCRLGRRIGSRALCRPDLLPLDRALILSTGDAYACRTRPPNRERGESAVLKTHGQS